MLNRLMFSRYNGSLVKRKPIFPSLLLEKRSIQMIQSVSITKFFDSTVPPFVDSSAQDRGMRLLELILVFSSPSTHVHACMQQIIFENERAPNSVTKRLVSNTFYP